MGIFLKIAGVIFIVLILVVTLAGLYLWRKWRRFNELMADEGLMVSRINLELDPDPDWMNAEEVQTLIEGLKQAGFSTGRSYIIQEMPVRLSGFFHDKSSACCIIYNHDSIGCWLDLMIQYEDGEDLTVSNALQGEELDHRPESVKIFRPGAGLEELLHELKNHARDKPRIRVGNDNFKEEFEKAYQREMQWRNERGGVTMEEIRRVADSGDEPVDESKLMIVRNAIKAKELYQWHEECIETFRQETSMSVAEWTQYENGGSFIIYSENLDSEVFIDYLSEYIGISEEEIEGHKAWCRRGGRIKNLFSRIYSTKHDVVYPKKVGAVAFPIEAEIFYIPYCDI